MVVKASLNLTITPAEFATAQSKKIFPGSSFTACVFDVKVGNVDLCISDFWVTPERMGMSNFLSPFSQDVFYLLVPDQTVPETILSMFEKPFKPFSWELWGLVFGFLFFSGFVNMLADNQNEDDFQNPHPVARVFKATYLSFAGYFQGGAANNPTSAPARVAQLGYGFFILIILASYTANLATILVAKSGKTGIDSIQAAIEQGVSICVLSAIHPQALAKFPKANFVIVGGSVQQIQALTLGKCKTALIHEQRIMKAFSGYNNALDCSLEDEDSTLACLRDDEGNPLGNRDCKKFKKVGEMLFSVPLSMPVANIYEHAFSFYMRDAQSSGDFEKLYQKYSAETPTSVCSTNMATDENELSLPWSSMVGTVMISMIFQFIALSLCAVEYCRRGLLSELCGCTRLKLLSDGADQDDIELDQDVVKDHMRTEARMVIQNNDISTDSSDHVPVVMSTGSAVTHITQSDQTTMLKTEITNLRSEVAAQLAANQSELSEKLLEILKNTERGETYNPFELFK
eukprot:CAMPEP_0173098872 /NCGR_PEP_ID=MMETSP1102-20130122/35075_1 /TAXON_ID=49646 /ORGANISM="Geminigera sp., Strain Caron Lab Isolate" /LENGTH=514 /DNA_ID=CAMNT_0013991623 /DNA_START=199 /DNA_END=1743 /DNA_ORIENTATION=+